MTILVKTIMALIAASTGVQAAEISRASARKLIPLGVASDFDITLAAYISSVLIMSIAVVILYVKFGMPPLLMLVQTLAPKMLGVEDIDMGVLKHIMNSVDPLESTFAALNVTDEGCRKRTVCEIQKASSKFPVLEMVTGYISPYIQTEAYKEAYDAGTALEDCAKLFSDCSQTSL